MFENYIKIALRNLTKHKIFSFINITGFALGMSLCFVLLLFIIQEFSYDRFHEDSDSIYRVIKNEKAGDKITEDTRTPFQLPEVLINEFPEVLSAAHLFKRSSESIRLGDNEISEKTFFEGDQGLFNVFSFEVLKGNKDRLLTNPNSLVITESMQQKYFVNEDPVGKILLIGQNQTPYNITGVIKDLPKNSHFHLNFLASLNKNVLNNGASWQGNRYPNSMATYLLLNEGVDEDLFHSKLNNALMKYYSENTLGTENEISFLLQPLLDIHLYSHYATEFEVNGNINYVYIMSIVALLIIAIASINFVNLSTANSNLRAKEIGMRKVSGADSKQLFIQFIGESVLLSTFAFLISLILIEALVPIFNQLVGENLEFSIFNNFDLALVLFTLSIFLGISAGIYPALFLSSFNVAKVLKSKNYVPGKSTNIRKVLVVSQFVIATTLIISSMLLLKQLNFLQNYDVGFDKEQVMVIPMMTKEIRDNYEPLKTKLKSNLLIEEASGSNNPTGGRSDNNNQVTIRLEVSEDEGAILSGRSEVDYDYFEAMGLTIVEGRAFSRNYPSDINSSIIINQTAAK